MIYLSTDHLDDLDPHLPLLEIVRDLFTVVQIQPKKHVLDRAEYTATTRQYELDHTDHTNQECIYIMKTSRS